MTELLQRSKQAFGSKGIVFTLDAALAAIIVVSVLSLSFYYISVSDFDDFSKIELARTGNDLLTVMDYDETLESLDKSDIEDKLDSLLPPHQNARVELRCYEYDEEFSLTDSVDAGDESPEEQFIASGTRHFLIFPSGHAKPSKYCTTQYYLWVVK